MLVSLPVHCRSLQNSAFPGYLLTLIMTPAVGANGCDGDFECCAGIVGMCKEHLGVALALKVPVFFVVTKVDICPGHVLQHSLATLSSILRKPGIKKKPYMVIGLPP